MKLLLPLLFACAILFSTARADATKTILVFGDSLTAGYGLDDAATEAFPGILQKKITDAGLPHRVINSGSSGETTAGGLRRIDWVLRAPVDIFILELGGNDGLRGLSPSVAQKNLQGIIDKVRAKNPSAHIVLAGMTMPTSMGEAYVREFSAIFPALAKTNNATLIPFLLEGVGGVPELNLPDGFHPNAAGHKIVAEVVWKTLEPLLK
ncbi:MAG: arylesterase [Opitutaceae bacterium]|nr:arylesterase [Opitutaceae bacterium]